MAVAAATGCLEVSKDRLRTSLATCWHFQRWQGATWTLEQAKARIYFETLPIPGSNAEGYTPAELAALHPYARIFYTEPPRGQLVAEPSGYSIRKQLSVELVQLIPAAVTDPQEIDRTWGNFIGDIWSTNDDAKPGLVELSKISEQGYFRIDEYMFEGPWRADWNEVQAEGNWQAYVMHFAISMDLR